jgi:hypothetical protein
MHPTSIAALICMSLPTSPRNRGKILYYYNGPDTVGEDTKNDIINWLHEESDYDDELYDKLTSN